MADVAARAPILMAVAVDDQDHTTEWLRSGAALAAAAQARAQYLRHTPPAQTTAPVWALRGLTLWRAVRALRRVWVAQRSRP